MRRASVQDLLPALRGGLVRVFSVLFMSKDTPLRPYRITGLGAVEQTLS